MSPARNERAPRVTSKLTTEDVVSKRARGEITCAECKRLKLKCDKKLPCSSCVRRGCSTICPQGSLTPGQGSRSASIDPELLHQKIFEMRQRIRQLEEALTLLQSGISSEKHALLRDDLLSIKFFPEIHQVEDIGSPEDALAETMDAFGTLAIGDSGESKYFGRSGGSEVDADPDIESSQKESVPLLMPDIFNRLSSMFPMGLGCATDSQKFEDSTNMMFDCLPPAPRAWSLLEAYMENAAWIFQPILREHVIDDFLTPIYNAKKERGDPTGRARTQILPHKFAVLFLVLAIGANMDFTLPPNNEEGKRYYHYARAALTHSSIFDSPMVETVQAVALLYHYRSTGNEPHSQDGSWALVGLGCKLAQSLGMHRDPARWNMDEKTANKRRRLFWELHSLDVFLTLRTGRPPSIEPSYVDCAFPQDRTGSEADFWNWKYQFNEVLSPIITRTLAANPPSYKTILELDRNIREKTMLAFRERDAVGGFSMTAYLQDSVRSQFRSLTMLYIHKSFFAQALLDHPENVLLSRYAPSFLVTSSCASNIIRASATHLEKVPELCSRWWIMWNNLFSAAIIVGSIVTRAPSSDMAPKAYLELGIAVDLFVKGAGPRGATATLVQLQEKASAVFHQFHGGSHPPSPPSETLDNASVDIDELAIFGGQTRVLFKKMLLRAQPNWDGVGDATATAAGEDASLEQPISSANSGSTHSVSEHLSSQPTFEQEDMNMQDVHPSLMEYMSMLSSTAYGASPHLSEHPGTGEMPGSSQFSAGPPMPDFFHHQPPADYSMQHSQTQTPATSFTYDPMLFGPFEQFYQEAASASGVSSDIWETKGPDSVSSGSGGNDITDNRWMGW